MKEVVTERKSAFICIPFVNKLNSRVHRIAIKVDLKYIRHLNTLIIYETFSVIPCQICAESPFVDKERSNNVPQRASEKFLPH